MAEARTLSDRLAEHIALIYPDEDSAAVVSALVGALGIPADSPEPASHRNLWDESDTVLITYGNTLTDGDEPPLRTLARFMRRELTDCFSAVHILPFFPYSSDDGFAVMDYTAVNPSLGNWDDITAISADYKLMADLVVNHASSRSRWFENFKRRVDPGKDYFFEAPIDTDVSQVVRPRSSPLLNTVLTADGERHVWCTFSPDQVDLNFANPAVLVEFASIIRHYLESGVRWFRMDAVAFLWKVPGTACMHLPQTHELIKLMRTLIEHHSPNAVVITETNVPNRENLTYFGNANEAHLIYNFSLPPLLLHTLLSGDCTHLKTWMMSLPQTQAGTAYLNFIASHDGIGMRPLDGLIDDAERDRMLEHMRELGGRVSMRLAREGYHKPYEINISLFDALGGTLAGGRDDWQQARFMCAHRIMLALEGIPAIYIHSLFGTPNDYWRLEHTGHNRSINRHIWELSALYESLDHAGEHYASVFREMKHDLSLRRQQAAFHPNAPQFALHLGSAVFGFWRQSINREQSIFCVNNVTRDTQSVVLADLNLVNTDDWWDLLSGEKLDTAATTLSLAPYQTLWLSNLGST